MHIFHKWSKWESSQVVANWMILSGITSTITGQKRVCSVCNKRQLRM